MDLGKSAWFAFALAGCMVGGASDGADLSPGGDPAIEDSAVAALARTRFWRALQSGKLLGPAAMAEMHSTVDATELQVVIPGLRYGLGILWVPTSCGAGYWGHLGDTFGFSTRNGVSDDGTRAVVVSQNTTPASAVTGLQFLEDDLQLVDQVMCAGR